MKENSRMTYLFRLLPVLFFGLQAVAWAGMDSPGRHPVSFVLLHVNDTHSRFFPRPVTLRLPGMDEPVPIDTGSVSQMAALIRQAREQHPQVLFLHAGDMVQGSLYYALFQGRADVQVYTAMGLDAMAAGNHEFDSGTPGMRILLDHAGFPILSANLDVSDDPDLAGRIPPYVIRQVDGEPVAVIGLVTEHLSRISSPSRQTRMLPVIETAQQIIDQLTARGVQIIILLTHIGYDNDLVLGASVTGADIIVGGHSHTLLGEFKDLGLDSRGPYPTVVTAPDGADVLVVHAWAHTRVLGKLAVAFDPAGRITSHEGAPRLIAAIPFPDENQNSPGPRKRRQVSHAVSRSPQIHASKEDPEVAAILETYAQQVAGLGKTVVGSAVFDLVHVREPDPGRLPVSTVAPVVADALRWELNRSGIGVDIAIQNAGGVRSDIRAGDITIETVYDLLPFQNTLVVFNMTGTRVRTLLEDALCAILDEGLSWGGFPYASGLRFTIDPAASRGDRIGGCEVLDDAGVWQAMDMNRVYRVAVNRFLAGGGDGYTAFAGLEADDTGVIDTQAFLDYVAEKKIIGPLPPEGPPGGDPGAWPHPMWFP
ncbi:MAG: bifunctional metallophosphatase/5'-nucleotidase [Desulfotignum sp.]